MVHREGEGDVHESAAITGAPPSATLAARIRAEQVRLAYGHLPLALLATVINALAVVALLWHRQTPTAALITWLAVALLLAGVRHLHARSYRRQTTTDALTAAENRFRYGALAAGVLWGSVALFPESSFAYQAMLTIILVGMSAGASITLSAHRGTLQAFLILTLLPMILRLALEGQALTLMLSAMGTLFLVMISAAASMFHRNTIDSIRLGLEAQQREEALKQAEDQYRHLFEMANDAILIVDPHGTVLNANPVAYTRLGYRREEMLGMDISRLLSPRFATSRQDRIRSMRALGSLSFESEHIGKDGRRMPVEVNAQWVDYHGQEAVLSIVRDISERKQAENRLRTLSRALEQAGEAVIITGHDGLIEYTNPAFTAITGYTPDEVWGQDMQILKMKGDQREACPYKAMWKAVRAGQVWQKELTGLCKDGREITMFMSFAPITDDQGRMSHFVGIQQDITEHVELEERLRQAQKMEAIGTLVGGIAHDFNNVLAGMTGSLFLAKQQTQHLPTVTEKIELSEKLAFSASRMVQQLLTFARKGAVEIKPMDLGRFMQETHRLYELSIPDTIDYRGVFCAQELPIRGDDTQLQQMIINLLNNARDAIAGVEKPCITLTLEAFDASPAFRRRHSVTDPRFARISIEDNGSGIPDDIKARIFEPFFTTKEVGSGTGLGLAMVYGTITSHGGLIDVESTPGTGTAFRIYLPLQPHLTRQAPVISDAESPVTGRGGNPARGRRRPPDPGDHPPHPGGPGLSGADGIGRHGGDSDLQPQRGRHQAHPHGSGDAEAGWRPRL
jgi:PAS domain S-box-containing protein